MSSCGASVTTSSDWIINASVTECVPSNFLPNCAPMVAQVCLVSQNCASSNFSASTVAQVCPNCFCPDSAPNNFLPQMCPGNLVPQVCLARLPTCQKQVLYCFRRREQVSGALLFSREGNWCSTVFKRRYLVLYCSHGKETGALLFSRRRKLVHFCSQEKEKGALLFLGEENRCTNVS